MSLYWRGRSLLRTLADTMVFVVLLVLVLAAARQAGVFEPESGRFTAIDGDSLRKGTVEYRLHAIDAPELHQSCETASARTYACGHEARLDGMRMVHAFGGPLSLERALPRFRCSRCGTRGQVRIAAVPRD